MTSPRSVLVLNTGSSSIRYALYNLGKITTCIFQGMVSGIGTSRSSIAHKNVQAVKNVNIQGIDASDHKQGLKKIVELLHVGEGQPNSIFAIGHRVVHGGEALHKPSLITDEVKRAIEQAAYLAPLHNPPALQGICVAEELFQVPQVAVFDTAFHSTIPPYAYLYALPYRLYEELRVRRYGFHGTSYQYLLGQLTAYLQKPKEEVNAIFFHLGAGSSMAVIKEGKCVDTTMGVTPLEGLVMSTRSGDVDPAIFEILASQKGMKPEEVNSLLNRESGLYGLCGEKDMRSLFLAINAGSEKHKLALQVMVHRIRKYLGAYLVHLEGNVDALVFSAGVGEGSADVRKMVCEGLDIFGIAVDEQKNSESKEGVREIHKDNTKIKVLVIPTDEELCIAQQTVIVVQSLQTS